jgi:hypothetical protein
LSVTCSITCPESLVAIDIDIFAKSYSLSDKNIPAAPPQFSQLKILGLRPRDLCSSTELWLAVLPSLSLFSSIRMHAPLAIFLLPTGATSI